MSTPESPLPTLPEPAGLHFNGGNIEGIFTAAQMRAYALAALEARPVQAGWVPMPRTPTADMRQILADNNVLGRYATECYADLLAAAPTPPTASELSNCTVADSSLIDAPPTASGSEGVASPRKYDDTDVPKDWPGLSAYENGWNAAIDACQQAAEPGRVDEDDVRLARRYAQSLTECVQEGCGLTNDAMTSCAALLRRFAALATPSPRKEGEV